MQRAVKSPVCVHVNAAHTEGETGWSGFKGLLFRDNVILTSLFINSDRFNVIACCKKVSAPMRIFFTFFREMFQDKIQI